ncbi:hypothetical protein M426DRAFT_240014 [Hypoxylon sp. CI-4A]|nr:hypothetical protein M426DRAFT_240014 [Hypoxylon sp. CI-4A]
MPYLWGPLWALQFGALLAASASASFIRPNEIFQRADDTCAQDFSPCSISGLPDNFCCDANSKCQVLAGNTTVLCCPKDKTCSLITTITCDLSLQNADENPTAEIKTTALNGVLPTCGTECCPFGYSCKQDPTAGSVCIKDADQSKKPATESTPSSTTTAPTSTKPAPTSTSKASTTVAVSAVGTDGPSKATETPAASTSAAAATTANTVKVIGGVIGGVFGVVFIIVAAAIIRYKRKQKLRNENDLQRHDSSSSFGNIISAPVPHANYPSQRLDFLAKQSQTTSPRSPTFSSPTAVASPPRKVGEEYEYGGAFMPPNSPYSPYSHRPDSEMSDVPRSYHASAEITGLRSLTHWKKNANGHANGKGRAPKTPNTNNDGFSRAPAPLVTITPAPDTDRRAGSGPRQSEGEDINIFADPLMVGGAADRPFSQATTWSNIQQRADSQPSPKPRHLGDSPMRRR